MPAAGLAEGLRGTGNLGLVIERATGSVLVVDTSARQTLGRVEGFGDLSHASVVFSPDQRLRLCIRTRRRADQDRSAHCDRSPGASSRPGNSIGGAISDDGELIAVSNYEPGGVRVFDAETLELVADIPALGADGKASKTVGLVDLPGRRFAFALYNAGEIWIADLSGSRPRPSPS